MEKQIYGGFSQLSPRGPAGIKSWGFAFHRVQALRVRMSSMWPQFYPCHTTARCPAVGPDLKIIKSLSRQRSAQKSGLHIYQRFSSSLPCIGNAGPHSRKPVLSPAQLYWLPYQIVSLNIYPCKQLREALFYEVLSKQSLNSNMCWVFVYSRQNVRLFYQDLNEGFQGLQQFQASGLPCILWKSKKKSVMLHSVNLMLITVSLYYYNG